MYNKDLFFDVKGVNNMFYCSNCKKYTNIFYNTLCPVCYANIVDDKFVVMYNNYKRERKPSILYKIFRFLKVI